LWESRDFAAENLMAPKFAVFAFSAAVIAQLCKQNEAAAIVPFFF